MSDGLSKLAALMGESGADSPTREQAEGEKMLLEDMNKVLAFVVKLVGDNPFDQQIVIEECAAHLRDQIRDEAEG